MISLWFDQDFDGAYQIPDDFACGGSVIGDRWVLTAAHCVSWLDSSVLGVGYGTNDLDRLNSISDGPLTVRQIIVHPLFDISRYPYDIALIETTESIGVEPLMIPFSQDTLPQVGERVIATGWGIPSSTSLDILTGLQRAEQEVKSANECFHHLEDVEASTLICAGTIPGQPAQGVCNGDSGGPLMIERDGQTVQVGITSFGDGFFDCADPKVPQYYTRLTEYVDWIQSHVPDVRNYTQTSSTVDASPDGFTVIPANSETSGTLFEGESEFYKVSGVTEITLTSLSGDADIYVHSTDTFTNSSLLCESTEVTTEETCRLFWKWRQFCAGSRF